MLRRGGFKDGDLGLSPAAETDLLEWVDSHVVAERSALAEWSAMDRAALIDIATHAQQLLDVVERTCLVHSDINATNLLIDPVSAGITALLDWEFASRRPARHRVRASLDGAAGSFGRLVRGALAAVIATSCGWLDSAGHTRVS